MMQSRQCREASGHKVRGDAMIRHGGPPFWNRGECPFVGGTMLEKLMGQILELLKSRQRTLLG